MKSRSSRKIYGLVVTPATRWGSWTWIAEVLSHAPDDINWIVVGYGKPERPIKNVKFIALPGLEYGTVGVVMSKKRWLVLNLLYMAPLAPIAWAVALWKRPRILAGNGFVCTAILLPVRWVQGGKLMLMFHAYTKNLGRLWDIVLRFVAGSCDEIFVVSKTAVEDLSRFVSPDKLIEVAHWAARPFFEVPLERPRSRPLRLLFVGRMEREKLAQCLRVGRQLAETGEIEMWAAGEGSLAEEFRAIPGSTHFGYITDRQEMADIFAKADILWAPVDMTYVSRPGVDALASGCPIVAGDAPAQETRLDGDERVPRSLVPAEIGWIVDGRDDTEALALLRHLNETGIPLSMRQSCRDYALKYHSEANTTLVTDRFALGAVRL